MPGKFEIKTTAKGKFFFNLKAANGEVILTSQQYKALAYAKKGVASVQKNAADAARFEIKDAKMKLVASYGAVATGNDNIYRVDAPDLRKAGDYFASVYSSGGLVAENLPFTIKKEGRSERDLL